MKEDKKWIHQVRKQLKDYSEPLPAGLWEAIEKDLETSSVQPKVIPLWRRWRAVAAAVAVVVVSSTALWLLWQKSGVDSTDQVPWVANVYPEQESDKQLYANEEIPPASVVTQVTQGAASLLASVTSRSASDVSRPVESNLNVSETHLFPDVRLEFPTQEDTVSETTEEAEISGKMRDFQRKTTRERLRHNAMLAVAEKPSGSRSWQIGVTTGNTFYSASNTFQGFSTLRAHGERMLADNLAMNSVDNNEMAYTQVLFHNRDRASETRVNHRMPVTVGVTLSYDFSERWSLETGLTYTLLSSELHTGVQSYIEEEQKLHYIGIPLKVKHTFWKNNWLTVYAIAGGAVEKCVSGTLETLYVTGSSDRKVEHSSLDINALQWSAHVAAGGQFNLTRNLGLYVEPGLAYYFDDGTGIETFRKEYPCNFNLQLGLRFTLPK